MMLRVSLIAAFATLVSSEGGSLTLQRDVSTNKCEDGCKCKGQSTSQGTLATCDGWRRMAAPDGATGESTQMVKCKGGAVVTENFTPDAATDKTDLTCKAEGDVASETNIECDSDAGDVSCVSFEQNDWADSSAPYFLILASSYPEPYLTKSNNHNCEAEHFTAKYAVSGSSVLADISTQVPTWQHKLFLSNEALTEGIVPYDAATQSINVWFSSCVEIEDTGASFGRFTPSMMYGAAFSFAYSRDGPIGEDMGDGAMGNAGQFVVRHFKYSIYPAETSMEVCERVRGLFTNSLTVGDINFAMGQGGSAASGSSDSFVLSDTSTDPPGGAGDTKCKKNSLRNFGSSRRASNGVGTFKFIETVVAYDQIPGGFCVWDGLCPSELALVIIFPLLLVVIILVLVVFFKELLKKLCGGAFKKAKVTSDTKE